MVETAVEHDASDPDLVLNARLRQLGPAIPHPTYSPSSTFNASPSTSASSSSTPSQLQRSTLSRRNPNYEPSTTPQDFTPSASNPAQSIFPMLHSARAEDARQNPALSLLTARYRLAEQAEREFENMGRRGESGRSFLDIVTLRQAVGMRESGVQEGEIEKKLGLRTGTVGKLGKLGVVGVARS